MTGGASAAYGSDAVSGVVNFILDKDYTGFKGEFRCQRVGRRGQSICTRIFDLRHAVCRRSRSFYCGGRGYRRRRCDGRFRVTGTRTVGTPFQTQHYTTTNGQPSILFTSNAALMQVAAGGIDNRYGVAVETAFGPGGTPYQFNYGAFKPATKSAIGWALDGGGGWQDNQFNSAQSLKAEEQRKRFICSTEL